MKQEMRFLLLTILQMVSGSRFLAKEQSKIGLPSTESSVEIQLTKISYNY